MASRTFHLGHLRRHAHVAPLRDPCSCAPETHGMLAPLSQPLRDTDAGTSSTSGLDPRGRPPRAARWRDSLGGCVWLLCWPHIHSSACPPRRGRWRKKPLSRAGSAAFQRPPWCILSFLGLGGGDTKFVTVSPSAAVRAGVLHHCPASISCAPGGGPVLSQDRGGRRALPASRCWPWVPGEPGLWSACQWHYPAPHSLGDTVEGHSSVLGDTSALSACSVPPINSAPTP